MRIPYTEEPSSVAFSFATGSVSLPYKMNQHGVVYHMNTAINVDEGGIMRSFETVDVRWAAGYLRPHTIQVWIREGQ